MRTIAALLLATLLTLSAGCAQKDWIDRTLVTLDVTGTWYGPVGGSAGGSREIMFELEQQGATVKGAMRMTGGGATPLWVTPGPIEGTVAGDVFRFKQTNGNVEGELKVSGDEMTGQASLAVVAHCHCDASIHPLARVHRPGDCPEGCNRQAQWETEDDGHA